MLSCIVGDENFSNFFSEEFLRNPNETFFKENMNETKHLNQVFPRSTKERNIVKNFFRVYDRLGELIHSCHQITLTQNSFDPRACNIVSVQVALS